MLAICSRKHEPFHIIRGEMLIWWPGRENSMAAFCEMLILPGGMDGAVNMLHHKGICSKVKKFARDGRGIAAICAAPVVLRDAGIAKDKRITGYPDTEQLSRDPNFRYTGNDVERDGNIITAKGMGKAAAFAFEIARAIGIAEEKIRSAAENSFIKI